MSQGFSVRVYGTVNGQPPYVADVNGLLPSVQATFSSPQIANFQTDPVNIWPIQPGAKMIGGVFCYGVIGIPPTGLNQFGQNLVVMETVATLATLRG